MGSVIFWLSLVLLSLSTGFRALLEPRPRPIGPLRFSTQPHEAYLEALTSGTWVKFISGASNQDVPLVRNLCFVYTLAGVDCVDVSADDAVIRAATDGIDAAMIHSTTSTRARPLLMISVNDDEDPHFRKAVFDPAVCPITCPRPCEKVCPAWAIPPLSPGGGGSGGTGVIAERCYGCGRCLSACPLGLIAAVPYQVEKTAITRLFADGAADAIEVHTLAGHEAAFADLWAGIGEAVLGRAKVLAVSFPDMGADTLPYLRRLQTVIAGHPAWPQFAGVQVWQADGRPMSGDLGKGTAHKASSLAAQLLTDMSAPAVAAAATAASHGGVEVASGRQFVQLAGGTNQHSAESAARDGLLGATGFGGFAFGGYARKALNARLHAVEDQFPGAHVEDHPDVLAACVDFAHALVASVKGK